MKFKEVLGRSSVNRSMTMSPNVVSSNTDILAIMMLYVRDGVLVNVMIFYMLELEKGVKRLYGKSGKCTHSERNEED